MKKKTILRHLKSILFGICLVVLPCFPQVAQAATPYDWTHQIQETYVVTPGYWDTQTYQSGWTTEQQLVSAAYTTTSQQWVSSGYNETYQYFVSSGYNETYQYWVSSGYTAYKDVWVSSGYTAYHEVYVHSGYEHYGGYYTYPYGHWIYYRGGGLCIHVCGGGATGRIWVSGPAVWHSDNYWVDTSHWERQSYWVDTSHWEKQSYWVDTSHWETGTRWVDTSHWATGTRWVDTSHWETVSIYHPAVYQTVTVPVYSSRQVWVEPVYGTRTVTVVTVIQPPVVNSLSITPNPALDTDTLKANVSSSDPAGYNIGAEKWTVSGPNGTTTADSMPTHLMPGNYQISVAVQNEAPDGTPAAWSDPFTVNESVNPAVVAEIDGVTLTNVVHPPTYIALPKTMPAGGPVEVESGYNITMHIASKGAGQLTTELYSGGAQIYSATTSVSDGGGDVTFFIPTSVANKSTVDVKFTLRCTDPAGYTTTAVSTIPGAFAINGSSTGDTLVNQTH